MVPELEHLLESRPRKSRAAFNSVSFPLVKGRNFPEAPSAKKGGLAQLVERLLCKQNVNGSNPLTSTIFHDSSRFTGNGGMRVMESKRACSSVG